MRHALSLATLSAVLAFGLNACSPTSDGQPTNNATSDASTDTRASVSPSSAPAASQGSAENTPTSSLSGKVIGLEGLGDFRLGHAVPKGSSWSERGAQTGDNCRTVSSPDYPGVYGIVVDGKVRRITVGQRSDVKLVEGIGVGASQRDVEKWFGGFRAEPHKYEAAPAKYLTAPNAASGDPAVRFEIGQDGKVKMIHVGMMPELALVEGCA